MYNLGVNPSAAPDEIKKAYRRLALQGGSEEKFKKIAEVYEILSDLISREQYNKTGSAPPKSSRGGIGAPPVFE